MSRASIVRVASAALLISALGCGTSGSKIPTSEVTAKKNASGVERVEVEVHSFYFKPSRIVVDAGTPVELTLKFKNFFTPHNMTCAYSEAGIQIDKSAGFMSFHRTKSIRFTPVKPGDYPFYCGVGSHMKKGMTGTLVVR